jgi:demethylmenaquinone methyltransferase/2-methoxy-6-polyprenyl-1,4-benzoquinol methylase
MHEPSREEIWKMFDAIAATYDRSNRLMTGGMDLVWRKKMGSFLPKAECLSLLDCATGTGDQITALMDHSPKIVQAVGIDLASGMLQIGKEKIAKKPYARQVRLQEASALAIPYPDNTFDLATISFGIRNVTDVAGCLKELLRVLKPNGRLLILESSMPQGRIFKKLHLLYMRHVLPRVGSFLSKNRDAYTYLNVTTESFPSGASFCKLLQDAGFKNCKAHPLSLGVVSIYVGDKCP